MNFDAAVTGNRICPLLVRQKDDQVGFPRQFGWLRNHGDKN
jgi:hypothetical protein